MLTQAEQRLRSAAEFTRADPAPLIGLGDALVAHAELLAPTSSGSTQHTAGKADSPLTSMDQQTCVQTMHALRSQYA